MSNRTLLFPLLCACSFGGLAAATGAGHLKGCPSTLDHDWLSLLQLPMLSVRNGTARLESENVSASNAETSWLKQVHRRELVKKIAETRAYFANSLESMVTDLAAMDATWPELTEAVSGKAQSVGLSEMQPTEPDWLQKAKHYGYKPSPAGEAWMKLTSPAAGQPDWLKMAGDNSYHPGKAYDWTKSLMGGDAAVPVVAAWQKEAKQFGYDSKTNDWWKSGSKPWQDEASKHGYSPSSGDEWKKAVQTPMPYVAPAEAGWEEQATSLGYAPENAQDWTKSFSVLQLLKGTSHTKGLKKASKETVNLLSEDERISSSSTDPAWMKVGMRDELVKQINIERAYSGKILAEMQAELSKMDQQSQEFAADIAVPAQNTSANEEGRAKNTSASEPAVGDMTILVAGAVTPVPISVSQATGREMTTLTERLAADASNAAAPAQKLSASDTGDAEMAVLAADPAAAAGAGLPDFVAAAGKTATLASSPVENTFQVLKRAGVTKLADAAHFHSLARGQKQVG